MAALEVLQFPDPQLKRKSEPVTGPGAALLELADDMLRVMYDEPGIGLAAPQVGLSLQLFVFEVQVR